MRKVALFSILLVVGLAGSQLLPLLGGSEESTRDVVRLLTMALLSFIMIHVGLEFDIDRTRVRSYGVDYGIAATAAAFPWIFCTAYFVVVLAPPGGSWTSFETWTQALLAGRFAAPTSAGILFSMLAAAGLAATWVFRKARVLAIFDDLDTVLLMIPLQMLLVGLRWQLAIVVLVMAVLLWAAWRYLHAVRLPTTWPWVIGYGIAVAGVSELIYQSSKVIDEVVPIHVEVLLPAFVLGCVLRREKTRPVGHAVPDHAEAEPPSELRAATVVSAAFMVLVGLSMPALDFAGISPGFLLVHALAVTALSNVGKMFPLFFYRSEADWRERLALCIGMWPRGEVGAGVLVISLGYGIGGPMIAVATLSLALNLLLTGPFIIAVKALLRRSAARRPLGFAGARLAEQGA